jgi:2-phospho-L-lactate/phosphoenolpyruvate guanylyltransferase
VNVAVLPAKPLALAKTRLAPALAPAERMAVARAMFDDVLAALRATSVLDAVLVVTADSELAERARAGGAGVVDEETPRGLNGAVALGTDAAVSLGAGLVIVVLSDVPLARPADVRELIARTPRRGGLLVPSKEGTGTNAMVRRPPAAFPPSFGGRSLERHVAAAERRHVPCVIRPDARVAFDVDTPDDLRLLIARPSATTTYAVAVAMSLAATA